MNHAPAAERNKEPILNVLKSLLPPNERFKMLEIASGTGQHITHFATYFKNMIWQPTEYSQSSFTSIQAFINHGNLNNVKEPLLVNVATDLSSWDERILNEKYDGIYCANMMHIAPWECSIGLFKSAGKLLVENGILITYGPYAVDGVLSPESNVNFDVSLRAQNKEWGIRDTKDLIKLANENQLEFFKSFEMPANNKILVFKKIID